MSTSVKRLDFAGQLGTLSEDPRVRALGYARVRRLEASDLPTLVSLRSRCFRSVQNLSSAEQADYFRDVFLTGPLADSQLRSLVLEFEGSVIGFLGLLCRRMRLGGRLIRAVTITQFMVAPEMRRLGLGRRLLQAAFLAPHDIILCDIPTTATQRIWESLGGATVKLYRLFYSLTLRPLTSHTPAAALQRIAQAIDLGTDHFIRANPLHVAPPGSRCELTAELIERHAAEVAGSKTLHACYSARDVEWLWQQADHRWGANKMRRAAVIDTCGRIVGWFVYVLKDQEAQVVQLFGGADQRELVIAHLVHHAWTEGAVNVSGRMQPLFLNEFAEPGFKFEVRQGGLLMWSRDPELSTHLLKGHAMVTGLDGEWPLHY